MSNAEFSESEALSLSLMKFTLFRETTAARELLAGLTREQLEEMLLSQATWSATNLLDQCSGDHLAARNTARDWTARAAALLVEQDIDGHPS